MRSLAELIESYDPTAPLEEAFTIPSAWYTDPRIFALEQAAVFGRTWQVVGRLGQVRDPGQYLTAQVGGEPVVVLRGRDGVLRAFYNVCRHHAAEVAIGPAGRAERLRCPYHGWTYSLEGELRGTPAFESVCGFDRAKNGLVPVRVDTFADMVFVNLDEKRGGLAGFLGEELIGRVSSLHPERLTFVERRSYDLRCNWKVYVDNYLDGGYHVPHIHKGLGSVLSQSEYQIESRDRFCLQSSPVRGARGDAETASVRRDGMAYYFWLYPNLMLNFYEGALDTNLVLPLAPELTRVVFDFYFADPAGDQAARSIAVSERIQEEDIAICESVQRGLGSRSYTAGRLSVRHESGEHLFHRLLHADLSESLQDVRLYSLDPCRSSARHS